MTYPRGDDERLHRLDQIEQWKALEQRKGMANALTEPIATRVPQRVDADPCVVVE
jgi:hypothetical protein